MDHFLEKNGVYHCEDVALPKLAAEIGTPAYVYSEATLVRHCRNFLAAFKSYPTTACFAVKSLSNLSVMQRIFAEGFGADLVSIGELERALLAGAKPDQIVFSGVGKKDDEIIRALDVGILMFNVESPFELDRIASLAKARGKVAGVALRVNPNIDAKTNEKISTGLYTTKFGLPEEELPPLLARIAQDKHLSLAGIGCHIGSQITELGPLGDAARRMAEIAQGILAQGHKPKCLDMGGGLGIRYRDEQPPSLEDYARTLIKAVAPTGLSLIVEPGRVLVGNIGILLTRVIGVKKTPARHFVIVDAAMNDLIRPSLYESFHEILPVTPRTQAPEVLCDVVGPVCETGDFLGKGRTLPLPEEGDLLAVRGCGAYASSMASQYNSRPRAAEVLVQGGGFRVVRPRETLESLWASELAQLDAKGRP